MFSKSSLTIAACLFLPITLLALAVAGYFWVDSLHRQAEWNKAEATVTRIEWKESTNSHGEKAPFAYAVFSFRSADGNVTEVLSQTAAAQKPLYEVGDKQWVIYPPDAPEEAMEDVFIVQYLLPLILTAAGIFIGIITALFFYFGHRAQRNTPLPPLPISGS
ncbi:MAG: DUF3592 domain-containing protein [Akkermansia sp.]|nr:DUF3592 domain-containing protein [Akkermansia sp.]